MMRNHGFAACGETIAEAMHLAFNLIRACEIQIAAMSASGSVDELYLIDDAVAAKTHAIGKQGGGGVNAHANGVKWATGELELEAWLRGLDNAGYRTGYEYKVPSIRKDHHALLNGDSERPANACESTAV